MGITDYFWPFWYELIGSICLGTFVNVMKKTGLQNLLLPFIWFAAHSIAWRVSRAHLNPAVSLANLLRRDTGFNFGHFLVYIIAQFGGFVLGLMLSWWFYRNPGRMVIWKGSSGDPQYHEACAMEFFGSLGFILIHMLSTHSKTALSANWGINCLVVGSFYGALVYWGQSYPGGSFNPAFGFAQNITDLWDSGDDESVEFIWIYVVFPFAAALAAWPIYEFIYRPAYEAPSQGQTCVAKPADSLAE